MCSFIIEKGNSLNGWLQLDLQNTFENRDDCKCLFERNTTPLKILELRVASQINDGTTQMYGCRCSFEIKIRLK